MSKGLESLESIIDEIGDEIPHFSTLYDIDMWHDDFKTIKKELEENEILKEGIRALYKENESLKETLRITDASGLSAMIQNTLAERDGYKEESQILKEGIKALSNYCSYTNERCNIQEDLAYIEVIFDAECIEEVEDGDYKKIKTMLEVLEND